MRQTLVKPVGTERTAEDPPQGRDERLDRQRAGVLRLLHLRHRGRAGLPHDLLPGRQRGGGDDRVAGHLRRGVRGPPGRLLRARPPRRHDRPQDRAVPHPVRDGPGHVPDRRAAHLRPDRGRRADPAAGAARVPGPGRGRRAVERELDVAGARTGQPPRVLHQLHPGGHPGRQHPGHRGLHPDRRAARRRRCCPGAGGSRSCSARWSWSSAGGSAGPCTRARRSRRSATTTRSRPRR